MYNYTCMYMNQPAELPWWQAQLVEHWSKYLASKAALASVCQHWVHCSALLSSLTYTSAYT